MALAFGTVTPATGVTGGRYLLKITGTDFDVPTETNPLAMKVKVGGRAATNVEVRSTGILTCVAPKGDAGTVSIELENLLTPATVVAPSAFTYALPSLIEQKALTFVVRSLILELKRQIIDEVVQAVDTDFDASTGDSLNLAELAKVPAIVLMGPRLVINRLHSSNQRRLVNVGGGISEERRGFKAWDLEFGIMLVDKHRQRLLNLIQEWLQFIVVNPFLEVDKVPGTPSQGFVQYEMQIPFTGAGEPNLVPVASNSNIQTARGEFLIRGVPLERDTPLTERETTTVDDVILEDTEVVNP